MLVMFFSTDDEKEILSVCFFLFHPPPASRQALSFSLNSSMPATQRRVLPLQNKFFI